MNGASDAPSGSGESVIFWDIDGTLLSTARAGILALEDAARAVCGVEDPKLDTLDTAGLTDAQVARRAIEHCGSAPEPATIEAFLGVYENQLPSRLPLRAGRVLPGVEPVLKDLAARPGVVSMLLTGNTRPGARAKLEHYGLAGYFDKGAFCESTGPREEIAGRALGLARESRADPLIVVIGDTPHDVRCGKAIGALTVAVASGQHSVEELESCGPDAVLARLPEPGRLAALVGLDARCGG